MQAYNSSFAKVYNQRWAGFTRRLAPILQAFYESTPTGKTHHSLLDICCGTGQLAGYFLDTGYTVTGLDLSPAMLEYARANNAPYITVGQARFLQADAASFTLDEQFGLAVSTFDALNHLPSLDALRGCFRSVFPLLVEGGWFAFDLNTLHGLRRWQSITVEDTEELLLITRGVFDPESSKAHTYISGFVRAEDGRYDRFEETAYNLGHRLSDVQLALRETGFSVVQFVDPGAYPLVPLEDPESTGRVMILAQKGTV